MEGTGIDWDARFAANMAALRARRAARQAMRAEFAEARRHGLHARHAAKLARLDTLSRERDVLAASAARQPGAQRRNNSEIAGTDGGLVRAVAVVRDTKTDGATPSALSNRAPAGVSPQDGTDHHTGAATPDPEPTTASPANGTDHRTGAATPNPEPTTTSPKDGTDHHTGAAVSGVESATDSSGGGAGRDGPTHESTAAGGRAARGSLIRRRAPLPDRPGGSDVIPGRPAWPARVRRRHIPRRCVRPSSPRQSVSGSIEPG
ncbi:hypothetical protein GCM10010399_78160 [Dactylosporangium fulvum]